LHLSDHTPFPPSAYIDHFPFCPAIMSSYPSEFGFEQAFGDLTSAPGSLFKTNAQYQKALGIVQNPDR
ncbi:unnamed protein product, partial [Tilletia controversa]